MNLAKPRIDVGLFTNALEPMLVFWQEVVGLAFEETLPLGHGQRQHRHAMNGSVFKLNHSRDPLPVTVSSGYREFWIARDRFKEVLYDPEFLQRLVVPLEEGCISTHAL